MPPPLIVRAAILVLTFGLLAAPIPRLRPADAAGTVEIAPEFFKDETLALLNHERAAVGLRALDGATDLNSVALARAVDMAANGYFAHVSPAGSSAETLLRTYGIPYVRMGENIALSNGSAEAVVRLVHDALMASDGHRASMLDPGFARVGIGIAVAERVYYFAIVFVEDGG